MEKTTLVVPAGFPAAEAFARLARDSGRRPAMLAIAGQAPDTGKMADGDEVDGLDASTAATDAAGAKTGAAPATGAVPWNPRSFVSAKAALMETETAARGRLDEAVLMADPPAMKASLNEASQIGRASCRERV